ncbi:MAG TPA: protein kinase [Gallionellaceae bacterium]
MFSQLGRYEVFEELGRGSMGIVYRAKDPLIDRFVAIKVINLESLNNPQIQDYEVRFHHEAKSAGRLNHPNIFTIHDMGKCGDVAYIAMEMLEGRELREMIDCKGGISVGQALDITTQVAHGLAYAHQRGVAHHDIKPANIMVVDGRRVKIADFGLAQVSPSPVRTPGGSVMGSPLYMSPEQVQAQALDTRSDIFSLGVILYEMLTQRPPFLGADAGEVMRQIVMHTPPPPGTINTKVPKMLDRIVEKCLEKNPGARYQDAGELADDLRACHEMLRGMSARHFQFVASERFKRLRHLAIPGGVPERTAAIGGFALIFAIFVADIMSDVTIQMHLLYVFPLIMMAFHCERPALVHSAVWASIFLQAVTLIAYGVSLPLVSKTIMLLLILPSNLLIAYVTRMARANFMEADHLSSFDWLTELRNRQSFESIVDAEIKRQKRYGGTFSLACIDIDGFTGLNADQGHRAGDEALCLLAQVMRKHVRQSDTSARLGGDEFAILMPHAHADDCGRMCQQLSAKISQHLGGAALPVSASIGYVTFDAPPVSTAHALERVAAALRVAKASGKGATARG